MVASISEFDNVSEQLAMTASDSNEGIQIWDVFFVPLDALVVDFVFHMRCWWMLMLYGPVWIWYVLMDQNEPTNYW